MPADNAVVDNFLDLIGQTSLVRLNQVVTSDMAEVLVKMEALNPARTVKDRVALSMIDAAERDGRLTPGMTIVEPTSGNTGIGLAVVAAARGYRLILTMPDSMSRERRDLLESYGAKLVLTPGDLDMTGAVEEAQRLVDESPDDMFMPQQFQNLANPETHRQTTAPEILAAVAGHLDAFVAGVGTGGTITGVGEVLKLALPQVQIIAVEPSKSPVLSGGEPGLHGIQGIGAGFVPEVLNRNVIDEIVCIDDGDAIKMARELGRKEGIMAGISAGANVFAALQVARRLGNGKRVVTVICDSGERYFSIREFLEA
ncbi:MAG: cysteine synthase A [Candidatus Latescibacterota bacterium]|jgi:cysteine synthase A